MARRSGRGLRAGVVALLVVIAACGDADTTDSGLPPATVSTTTTDAPVPVLPPTTATDDTTSSTVTPAPIGERKALADIELGLEEVGTFEVPVAARVNPDGRNLYVAEKGGRILRARDRAVVLDLSARVSTGNEQGLLGLAFDATGSRLFASFTDTRGESVVEEYGLVDGIADLETMRELLRLGQPFGNHNGGDIHLGPDGFLWLAYGDGGSAGDPDGNGQDNSTLLGSILRIDPDNPGGGKAYGIPTTNPFVTGGGAGEIWLYGVRNPWRISFDRATGDLWVADVGQRAWEEINVLPAPLRGKGANLGWNVVEGTHAFAGGPAPDPSIAPIYEYSHDGGRCSITGGFVYRGTAIPALDGAYFFADYCAPGLEALRTDGTVATEVEAWPLDTGNVVSFGVDANGEILVLSQQGTIHRIIEI